MHRFFTAQALGGGKIRINDREFLNQTRNVLRLKAGEEVILFNGDMNETVARIDEYGDGIVFLSSERVFKNQSESDISTVLYCSVLKKENFEWVAQKATEIGIKELVPIISSRTIKLNLRPDRIQKIIKEAAEQSGRGIIPVAYEPMMFDEAVEHSLKNGVNFFTDISGDIERHYPEGLTSAGIWIGPEGGWKDDEISKAREAGFKIISLGRTVLRAETAAVIASYSVLYKK